VIRPWSGWGRRCCPTRPGLYLSDKSRWISPMVRGGLACPPPCTKTEPRPPFLAVARGSPLWTAHRGPGDQVRVRAAVGCEPASTAAVRAQGRGYEGDGRFRRPDFRSGGVRALADREATKSGWSPDPILGWGSSSRRRIQSNLLVVHGRVIGLPGIPAVTWQGNTRALIFDLLDLLAHRHGSWR
jgi:hypothetical protein